MHKGRGALAIAVALFMFLSAVPFMAAESEAVPAGVDTDGVLLYEIGYKLPTGNTNYDGLSVKNYGDSEIDLDGYTILDESGKTVSLKGSLAPGKVAAFVKSIVSDSWFCETFSDREVYVVSNGQFSLNNGGDNVYLKDPSGKVIDVVSYKSPDKAPSTGWSGPSVTGSTADQAIKRVEPTDTNTYFDWIATSGEHTSNGFYDVPQFDGCTVEPFVFPDANGRPIFDAVMSAESSIHISIYMMTSDYMISLLAYKASQGREVKLLLENKPLGYDHPLDKLAAIEYAGGEVSFIGFESDHDRYSYVHNKYAIIDGETVVVTSENWTGTNLSDAGSNGNRGWGAVITSEGYAAYMESYFSNDWDGSDVGSFTEKTGASAADWNGKKSNSQITNYVNSLDYTKRTYTDVSLKMYMSPDNTLKALQYYMESAEERIYTEQMDIGKDFYDLNNETPLKWMKAAADRGVDSRFLIKDTEARDFVNTLNSSTNVKAAMMTNNGYSTMHNKGVIIDDCVWVSSVNWTMNAFTNNRECGLYFMDADVTEFYLSEYMEDWNHDYTGDSLTVTPVMPTVENGPVSFTVNGISGACEWKIVTESGEESCTTDAPTLSLDSSEGLLYVLVKDSSNNTGRFIFSGATVPDSPDEPDDELEIPVVAAAGAAGVGILGFIILLIRRFLKR